MKILETNLKEGRIKLRVENLDDLWYLKSLLRRGDRVAGIGHRRIRDEERIRADKGERIPVFMEIKVEEVEFSGYINRLRITGIIEKAREDLIPLGSYHTLNIAIGNEITIIKEWKKWELERLKEIEKLSKAPLILIACIEEGECEIAIVRSYGVDFVARITSSATKKRAREFNAEMKKFYHEIARKIEEEIKKSDLKVIICGPGFTKENFYKFLKENYPEIAKLCYIEATGCGGRAGVQEVIKRGAIEKILEESRVTLETSLVEKVFERIARASPLVAYGMEEVKKALSYGAVEHLLVTDIFVRQKKGECDKLIEKAERLRSKVIIVSTEHEAGEKLQSIGGIAALLRFEVY